MRHLLRPTRGFTVTELLVATFIAILILLAGFTILNGASTARKETQLRIIASGSAQQFFELLEKDLACAYPGPAVAPPPPINKDMVIDSTLGAEVLGDAVQMYTANDSRSDKPGPKAIAVRYFVRPDKKLHRQVYVHDAVTPASVSFPVDVASVDNSTALFPDAEELRAQYFQWDPVAKGWTPAAPGSATHINVKLKLTSGANRPALIFQKTLALPATYGP